MKMHSFQDQNAMAYRFEYIFISKNIFNVHITLIHCVKYEKSFKSGYQEN